MKGLNLYNSVVNSLWFNQIAEADKNSSYPTLLQLFESSDLEKKDYFDDGEFSKNKICAYGGCIKFHLSSYIYKDQ